MLNRYGKKTGQALGAVVLYLTLITPVTAKDDFDGSSLEVGAERLVPVVPDVSAAFTGVLINYYPMRYFYIGTSQTALYLRGASEYRPDFHAGFIFPILDHVAFEATVGFDFLTAVIIALAILDDDNSVDYRFASTFYSPYFSFTGAIRIHFDGFALKLMAQTQLGGYLQRETSEFNTSLWLGLGATYRFNMR